VLVDMSRDQVLADAALSRDQHLAVAGRRPFGHRDEGRHLGVRNDQARACLLDTTLVF